MQTANTRIRLGGRPGWSVSSLGVNVNLLVFSNTGSKISTYIYLCLIARKPVFRVCDQEKFNSACSVTGTSQNLEISHIISFIIILSRQHITKVLIRLHGCAGWYAPLFVCNKIRFSRDKFNMQIKKANLSKPHPNQLIKLYIYH